MPILKSAEEVARFAQRTAQAVRCVAQRWWRIPNDPDMLHIEAQLEGSEPPRLVVLRTFIGKTKR